MGLFKVSGKFSNIKKISVYRTPLNKFLRGSQPSSQISAGYNKIYAGYDTPSGKVMRGPTPLNKFPWGIRPIV
jgi:hypothetical protein